MEVWLAGELLEARTFPNHGCAHIFAEHKRARGFYALVTYPRAEPWRNSRYIQERLVGAAADDQS